MAFNFFGTFTRAQWWDFKDFAMVQREELELRAKWLKAELARVGEIKCVYSDDNMTPISYTANPNSYAGKLLLAYRMLGGVPEYDMLLRSRAQAVSLQRGASQDDSPSYSNGRVNRGGQIFDRSLGLAVEKLKTWQLEAIKSKREHLEFKIKRALDYYDQLKQEYELVADLAYGFGVDEQIVNIEVEMMTPGRTNVPTTDGDRYGLQIGPGADPSVDTADDVVAGNKRA